MRILVHFLGYKLFFLFQTKFSEPSLEPYTCIWVVPLRAPLGQVKQRPLRIWPRRWPNSAWCSTAPTVWITLPWENSSR